MENKKTRRIFNPDIDNEASRIINTDVPTASGSSRNNQPQATRKRTKIRFPENVTVGMWLKEQRGELEDLKQDFDKMSHEQYENHEHITNIANDVKTLDKRWKMLRTDTQELTREHAFMRVANQDRCEDLNLLKSKVKSQSEVIAGLEEAQANLTEQLAKHKEETKAQLRAMESQYTEMKNDLIERFREAEERLYAKLDQITPVKITVSDEVPSPPAETSSWWSLPSVKKYATYGLACVAVTAVAYGVVKALVK